MDTSIEINANLEKIKENCEECIKLNETKPRHKCAMPRANEFNQIVTIDLKEFKRDDAGSLTLHLLSNKYAFQAKNSKVYS